MGRKKIYENAAEKVAASRKRRRDEKNGPNALRIIQANLTLAHKFIIQDLEEAWGLNQSQVVARLVREAEERYGKEIREVQEKRREARKREEENNKWRKAEMQN